MLCAAWVQLVKFRDDGSEVVEELGPATRRIDPAFSAIMEPGTAGLVMLVKASVFQQRIQFPASMSVADAVASKGFFDPFIKEVSDDVDVSGGNKEVVVTAYSGVLDMPAIATTVILNLIELWNEFLYAVVLVTDDDKRTLPLGIMFIRSTCFWGRKSLTRPSLPRKAFNPSKIAWA